MNELTISLDSRLSQPLYEQIYEHLKKEIQSGGLPCEERLPSTRMLSKHLDVSRSTVTLAYEQLLSEGYIENKPNRGFFVSDIKGLYQISGSVLSDSGEVTREKAVYQYDFSPSGVDLEKFPHNIWRKLSKNLLLDNSQELFRLGDPKGERKLRETIASYLHQARGVRCRPEQIVIGAGNDYLLMLLHTLLGEKRVYAFERYTYKKAADIVEVLGNTVKVTEMDESGMKVDALKETGASVAYVMPSHQYPLGIVMPVKRRLQLLSWAMEKEGRYIIEDDYDSEFRYKGKPIPALQGYDTSEKVIYIGTFSKSIAPAIRISFLVLPIPLLEMYEKRGRLFSTTVPRMDQQILMEFIQGGYYERHLNRMRSVYRTRHDMLLESLRPFQNAFRIRGEHAGTHILLELTNGKTETEAIDEAKKESIRICGLSSYELGKKHPSVTLILGYVNIMEKEIPDAARKLGTLLSEKGSKLNHT